MIPRWLDNVIADHASDGEGALINNAAAERFAENVVAAIPKHVIVAAIESAAAAVLKQRGIADPNLEVSRELARNSAATVLLMLAVDE